MGAIKRQSTTISDLKRGSTLINYVYRGAVLIWQRVTGGQTIDHFNTKYTVNTLDSTENKYSTTYTLLQ